MSKSTPITQLPMGNEAASMFVNDQQRQMVQQAQNAQQGFAQPQSSQMSSDVAEDDDAMLKEVFNSINGEAAKRQSNPGYNLEQPLPAPPSARVPEMLPYPNYYLPAPQNAVTNAYSILPSIADAQQVLTTAGVIFGISMLPVAVFLSKYLPLDRIPNGELALKALLAAVVLMVIRRYAQESS